MEVDDLGYGRGTQSALARMRPARPRSGRAGRLGAELPRLPPQASYCAAKFAIRGFTDGLRTELLYEQSKIKLTMVQLPGLNTPQFTWCARRC